jgi:hypothetical protein
MAKKEEGNRNAADRLGHHEKIMHLIIDKAKVCDRRLDKIESDLEGVIEWIDRGAWGRMWDRIKKTWDRFPW